MNMHPVKGEEIIRPVQRLAPELPIIRHHHEWYNGSGYPDHLVGEGIPKLARILHVADAFEAMTAARPYRMTPLTAEQAMGELRKYAGIQFDPVMVDAFARTHYVADVADAGRPPMAKPIPLLAQAAALKAGNAPHGQRRDDLLTQLRPRDGDARDRACSCRSARSTRESAPPSRGRRCCCSRSAPRSRAGRASGTRGRGSTWRSSRSSAWGRRAAAASHARARAARRRRVGQQHVIVVEHVERHVGGVALLAVGDHEAGASASAAPARGCAGWARPRSRCRARPAGHAVDVGVDRLAGHLLELVPAERERVLDLAPDPEVPGRRGRSSGPSRSGGRATSRSSTGRGDAALLLVAELAAADQTIEHADQDPFAGPRTDVPTARSVSAKCTHARRSMSMTAA